VEAAVMLYNRLMNREQFWRVLKTLGPMEQALTIHRVGLGSPGVLPQQKNTMHYRYAPSSMRSKAAVSLCDLRDQTIARSRVAGRFRGRLDCKHPEMMTAAKKLIAMGQEDSKQNWVNTYIQGRRLRADVVENDSMFQFLTRDFTQPVLELDYCGVDFAELCLLWENRRNESDRRAWVATLMQVVEPLRCVPVSGMISPYLQTPGEARLLRMVGPLCPAVS